MAAEVLYPDNDDTSNNAWTQSTGASMFGVVDEVVADDADYLTGEIPGAGGYDSLRLANPTGGPDATHVVKIQWRNRISAAVSDPGDIVRVSAKLYQGTTLIATGTYDLTTQVTYQAAEYTLSQAEKDAISDWDDLRIRISALQDPFLGGSRGARISWLNLDIAVGAGGGDHWAWAESADANDSWR